LTLGGPKTSLSSVDAEIRAKLDQFLSQKGLRRTAQRTAILDAAFTTHDHYTAEDLLRMSRRRDATVSRATVYRTLALLNESGLLKELDLGKDHKYYDPNYTRHPNHHHIICNDCDKIVEFESEDIEKLESEITHKLGFSIGSQHLEIHGNCEDLKKTGACANLHTCERKKGS
jgi:Fur family transcriptional regulator, ferric uptake regulator